MKKLLFLITTAAFLASVNAQDSLLNTQDHSTPKHKKESAEKTVIWSIGIEPSVPIGNFNSFSGFGLGGSLQGEIKTGGKTGITIDAGFINYFGKTADSFKYADFKYWPVMGGLKYYMSGNTYLHAQLGPGFGSKGLGTSFWYGAGIGVKLGKVVDGEFGYMGWKQNETSSNSSSIYNGGTGGDSGSGGSGGLYGGHYSTLGIRLAVNF